MKKKEHLGDPWVESVISAMNKPLGGPLAPTVLTGPPPPTFEVRRGKYDADPVKVIGYPHFQDGVLSFTISGHTVKAFNVWYDLTRLTEVQVEDD